MLGLPGLSILICRGLPSTQAETLFGLRGIPLTGVAEKAGLSFAVENRANGLSTQHSQFAKHSQFVVVKLLNFKKKIFFFWGMGHCTWRRDIYIRAGMVFSLRDSLQVSLSSTHATLQVSLYVTVPWNPCFSYDSSHVFLLYHAHLPKTSVHIFLNHRGNIITSMFSQFECLFSYPNAAWKMMVTEEL